MEAVTLDGIVTFGGKSAFNRERSITFGPLPHDRPDLQGFYWKIGEEYIRIDLEIIRYSKFYHCFFLEYGDYRLYVYEHIGALRNFGLTNVYIECTSEWYPYKTTGQMWEDHLQPHLRPLGFEIEYFEIAASVGFVSEKKGLRSEVHISPSKIPKGISFYVSVDYKGLGTNYFPETIITPRILEQYYRIPSQGYPSYQYWIVKLCGWLECQKRIWIQDYKTQANYKNVVLGLFLGHRILDLSSVPTLLDHRRLMSCHIDSINAGHFHDLEVLKKVRKLVPEKNIQMVEST